MFPTKMLWAGSYMCTSILVWAQSTDLANMRDHKENVHCTCGVHVREREREREREAETTNLVFPLTRCAVEIILEGNPLTGDQCNHSNHWLMK